MAGQEAELKAVGEEESVIGRGVVCGAGTPRPKEKGMGADRRKLQGKAGQMVQMDDEEEGSVGRHLHGTRAARACRFYY